MSGDLAIATVTATLREWIRPALEADVTGAQVSMSRPDQIAAFENPGVNLFLYQVTPNPAWRNDDLPTRRGSDGEVLRRPQAALDLHYLLTCFGDETLLEPQRVLGSVVRTLHSRPVLSREAIDDVIAEPSFSYLAPSTLAQQIERVRLTPLSMSLEELSNLWSVFFQTAYRLSVAYIASLVLIESDDRPRESLPVRLRNVYARPFRQPFIETLEAAAGAREPITDASTLIVAGRQLRGEVTVVRVGGAVYRPGRSALDDGRIVIDLAADTPDSGDLRAGLQGVQVVHRLSMGTPPVEHEGVESNVMALMLRPRIAMAGASPDIAVSAVVVVPDDEDYREVSVRMELDVGQRQRAVLLLNEFDVAAPRAFSFVAQPRSADGDTVVFRVPADIGGEFVFRVQIDGAQSLLEVDPDDTTPSPTFGQYHQPRRTLP